MCHFVFCLMMLLQLYILKKNIYVMDSNVGLSPLVRVEREAIRETIGEIVGSMCEQHYG